MFYLTKTTAAAGASQKKKNRSWKNKISKAPFFRCAFKSIKSLICMDSLTESWQLRPECMFSKGQRAREMDTTVVKLEWAPFEVRGFHERILERSVKEQTVNYENEALSAEHSLKQGMEYRSLLLWYMAHR